MPAPQVLFGSSTSIKTLAPNRRDQPLHRSMSSTYFEIKKTSQKATIAPSPISKRDDESETTVSDTSNPSLCDDSEEFVVLRKLQNQDLFEDCARPTQADIREWEETPAATPLTFDCAWND
jgi:hypothetical protein